NDHVLCGFKAGNDRQPSAFLKGTAPLEGPARLFAKSLGDGSEGPNWQIELPRFSQVKGMVLAGDGRLFVAGRLNGDDRSKQSVRAYSVESGSMLQEYPLPAPPVYEGLAVAGKQLYVSLADGTLRCLGEK